MNEDTVLWMHTAQWNSINEYSFSCLLVCKGSVVVCHRFVAIEIIMRVMRAMRVMDGLENHTREVEPQNKVQLALLESFDLLVRWLVAV